VYFNKKTDKQQDPKRRKSRFILLVLTLCSCFVKKGVVEKVCFDVNKIEFTVIALSLMRKTGKRDKLHDEKLKLWGVFLTTQRGNDKPHCRHIR